MMASDEEPDRPAHPMVASVVLVTAVVLLIVALSVAGTVR